MREPLQHCCSVIKDRSRAAMVPGDRRGVLAEARRSLNRCRAEAITSSQCWCASRWSGQRPGPVG